MKNQVLVISFGVFIGTSLIANSTMKCGADMQMDKNVVKKEISSKCGEDMKKRKIPNKKEMVSKCGSSHMKKNAGKCGGGM